MYNVAAFNVGEQEYQTHKKMSGNMIRVSGQCAHATES